MPFAADLTPTSAPRRTTRALALTCTAIAVGTGAHVAAGGSVAAGGVATAFPVLLALAWWVAHRERGWLAIAGAQLAGQQVVHAVLDWPAHPVAGASVLPDDMSLAAHVVAAAVLAAWLRRGERRVWHAARSAVRAAVACLRALVDLLGYRLPEPGVVPRPGAPLRLAYPPLLLRHAVVRRGPPLHV